RVVEMQEERFEKAGARLALRLSRRAAHAYPRLHEGAHEPRPDGTLVIGSVALADAALIARRVAGLIRRERAEAEWRQQPSLDGVDDTPSSRTIEHRERQTPDREDLVRAKRWVDGASPVVYIDHVVERPRGLVPEAVPKSCEPPRIDVRPPLGEGAPDAER